MQAVAFIAAAAGKATQIIGLVTPAKTPADSPLADVPQLRWQTLQTALRTRNTEDLRLNLFKVWHAHTINAAAPSQPRNSAKYRHRQAFHPGSQALVRALVRFCRRDRPILRIAPRGSRRWTSASAQAPNNVLACRADACSVFNRPAATMLRASQLALVAAVLLLASLALTAPGAFAVAAEAWAHACGSNMAIWVTVWCRWRRRLAAQAHLGPRRDTGCGKVRVHRQPFQGHRGCKGWVNQHVLHATVHRRCTPCFEPLVCSNAMPPRPPAASPCVIAVQMARR